MLEGSWYDNTTGEICGYTSCSDTNIFNIKLHTVDYKTGKSLFPGRYDKHLYYINVEPAIHSPTMRSESNAVIADSIISNIHNPSTVDCGDLGVFEVTDGVFEFTVDTPGLWPITVKSVPYFDKTFEVINT